MAIYKEKASPKYVQTKKKPKKKKNRKQMNNKKTQNINLVV